MRDYELVYIVSPQLAEENLAGVVEKVNQVISGRGGQVDKVDSWGKRRLAYPIGPFREGIYFLTQFKLAPAQAPELDDSLRTTEEIIRHLVVRLEPEQVRRQREQQAQAAQQTQQAQQALAVQPAQPPEEEAPQERPEEESAETS